MAAEKSGTTFPRIEKSGRGYDIGQVESFLSRARAAFESPTEAATDITSKSIRNMSFDLKKQGYDPKYVDAALDRLEELFFAREKKVALATQGQRAWETYMNTLKKEILDRASRPEKQRFVRQNIFAQGYRRSQVDAAVEQIAMLIKTGGELKPKKVRQLKFYAQSGGYNETQVDAYLDGVVEFLLARG